MLYSYIARVPLLATVYSLQNIYNYRMISKQKEVKFIHPTIIYLIWVKCNQLVGDHTSSWSLPKKSSTKSPVS